MKNYKFGHPINDEFNIFSANLKHITTFILIFLSAAHLRGFHAIDSIDNADTELEMLLDQKLETASKYEQKKSEAPASVIIITEDEIKKYCNLTFAEIISKVRGFYQRNDHNYPYLGARGFDRPSSYSNNVLLLIDGHVLNENVYGQPFFSDDLGFGVNVIERIEIVEGPGSALYGTGAILAVINIITKKGKLIDGLQLTGEAGSYNSYIGGFSFGKQLATDVDFFISARIGDSKGQDLYFREFDTPENNNGIADNLDWERFYGIYSKVSFNDFVLNLYLFSREKGIPTAAYETIFNDSRAKTSDKRKFVDLSYNPEITHNLSLSARVFYDNFRYDGIFPYDLLQTDGSNGNWAGSEIMVNWDIDETNRLVIGTEIKKHINADYELFDDSVVFFDNDFPYYTAVVFLQDYWQVLSNFSVNAGLSYNHNSLSGSYLAPRLSTIFNAGKNNTIKLLYGSAFRSPNIYELYYYDDMGSIANPKLKAEKINSYEIVWESILSNNFDFSVSLYHYFFNDLINQVAIENSSGEFFQFTNQEKVWAYGMEFDCKFRFDFGLAGYLNFSHQILKDKSNTYLTNSPKYIVKVGIVQELAQKLYGGADFLFESDRITIYGTKTKAFTLLDLYLKYTLSFGDENTLPGFLNNSSIYLKIKNLLDLEYYLPGGYEHNQQSLVQYGRTVTLGLNLFIL